MLNLFYFSCMSYQSTDNTVAMISKKDKFANFVNSGELIGVSFNQPSACLLSCRQRFILFY